MRIRALALAGLTTLSSVAQGQPAPGKPAALSFVRLEGAALCPDAREFAARIERQLGRDALTLPESAELFVEASISTGGPGTFRVSLVLTDREGRRLGTRELSVEGATCDPAADAAALAIALMLDPDALGHRSPNRVVDEPPALGPPLPQAASPAAAPSTAAVCTTSPTAPPPPPAGPPQPAWGARLQLGAAVRSGVLPGLARGGWAAFALAPTERLSFELGVEYLPQRRQSLEANKGADFSSEGAFLGAWWTLTRRGATSVAVGVDTAASSLLATGYGFAQNRAERSLFWSAGLGAQLGYAVMPRFVLQLRPSVEATLWHDDYGARVGTSRAPFFEPAPFSARLAVGVALGP